MRSWIVYWITKDGNYTYRDDMTTMEAMRLIAQLKKDGVTDIIHCRE